MAARRGTTNGNVRGNSKDRARRRAFVLETYRANVDALVCRGPATEDCPLGPVLLVATADPEVHGTPEAPAHDYPPTALGNTWAVEMAARCYRCGDLLVDGTLTVDCTFPRVMGGRYGTPVQDRREKRTNTRPACAGCNSETGGTLSRRPKD